MKILVLCDIGSNRSVTIAHQLKFWGHDVLAAGIKTNSPDTLVMLTSWADRIIVTEPHQADQIHGYKVQLWDVGPDTYPRPFNKELLAKVKFLVKQHEAEYKAK